MEKEYKEENKEEQVVDTAKIIKRVRKSRKVRSSRRKQTALRKTFRFFMTIFLLVILGYVSKLPQWYLPKNTFTAVNNNIIIKNNKIVKSNRILAFLKLHKVPDKPIYMLRTDDIEKDIKKLRPIKEVYIRRYAFPARLQIIVKERNPILSIALDENSPIVGAFAEDGVLIGHEFMPLNSDIKTIKVITKYGGEDSYTKWTLAKVQKIQKIAEEIELYAEEPLEYIHIRNPNDIYAKVKTTKIRVGKPDGSVFERIKRIPSILPKIKLINTKVQYLDISWEKVNYLKLK